MKLKNKKKWQKYVEKNTDPYGGACIKVAKRTMELLDNAEEVKATDLIRKADKELNEGITGAMAGAIAFIVTQCHERGQEFKKSWNKEYGQEKATGVVNPAVLVFKDKKK